MLDEAGGDFSTWCHAVRELIDELGAVAQRAGDSTLDSALKTARESMDAWCRHSAQLAVHERAREDASSKERQARQRVGMVLDLVAQLAALPNAAPRAVHRPVAEHADVPPGTDHPVRTIRAESPNVAANLLGSFELRVDGSPVTDWRGRRGPAVLQFLISRRAAVDRETLVEALWPGMPEDVGRPRLHQAVYLLRQTLHRLDPDREHILCENGSYRLNPTLPLWTDVAEFDRLATVGTELMAAGQISEAFDAYRRAEQLYRGDFLENCTFAEWATAERRRLREAYVVMGNRLAQLHAERADHPAALATCTRVLARDTWNETATLCAMRSHVATGNRSLALDLFRTFASELGRELGVAPSPDGQALYREILGATGPADRRPARAGAK